MGLSDEERESQLYWSCHRIYELGRKLEKTNHVWDTGHLRELCNRIWVEFIGRQSNGIHWFAGSSASNKVRNPDSPWSVGLLHNMDKSRAMEPRRSREKFDPFDGFLDITGLIRTGGEDSLATVYEVFAWTEQAVYALRRYDDDYMRQRQGLSDLIATIQGVCFGIFSSSDRFAKAYVLNQTLTLFYGPYWNDSVLRAILDKQHWHHNLSRPMEDYGTLRKIREWHYRATVAETETEKVIILMEIVGRRFHYKHQLREMCRMLREGGVKADYKAIWTQFQKNEAAHAEHQEDRQGNYSQEQDREEFSAIHGYSSWGYDDECPVPFDDAMFEEERDGEEE